MIKGDDIVNYVRPEIVDIASPFEFRNASVEIGRVGGRGTAHLLSENVLVIF